MYKTHAPIKYKVEYTPAAVRQIKKLGSVQKGQVIGKIEALAKNPYPLNVKKLKSTNFFRIRACQFRIIYTVRNEILLITIIKIGARKKMYIEIYHEWRR